MHILAAENLTDTDQYEGRDRGQCRRYKTTCYSFGENSASRCTAPSHNTFWNVRTDHLRLQENQNSALIVQLRNHLESMDGNASRVAGISDALMETTAALDDVLYNFSKHQD